MTSMKRKIISDKRVDEVIFGFADYADVYYEKDDRKIYETMIKNHIWIFSKNTTKSALSCWLKKR